MTARTRKTLSLLAILLAAMAWRGLAQSARVSLADADKLFAEKSYAAALDGYAHLLKANEVPAARKNEVQYRVIVSLGKTEQWDKALAQGLDFVKTHRETIWEPRGLYWLGRLYLGVPHNGYRVGQTVYRGDDAPQGEGNARPEQVYLYPQDAQNALDALEAARVYFAAYREKENTQAEEVQLDFDLAHLLETSDKLYEWMKPGKWPAPADASWKINPDDAYSPDWPTPKKLLYLYEQARTLALPSDKHSAALALFGKALWLRQYHHAMRSYIRPELAVTPPAKENAHPYPYQDDSPLNVLRQLIEIYSDDAIREQAQYTLAFWQEQDGQFNPALAEYRRLIAQRPQSKWVEDAQSRIGAITRRQLSLYTPVPAPADAEPRVNVNFRNVQTVHFRVYRYTMEADIGRPERLNDPAIALNRFEPDWNTTKQAKHYGPLLAEWDLPTKDMGAHLPGYETVTVPVKGLGAYIVEATAPDVKTACVVIVSDLVMVEKMHRDGALLFVTDARTGEPVSGAQVIARQTWSEDSDNKTHAGFTRGQTTPEGLLSIPLLRAPGRRHFRVSAFAYQQNRYALTESLYSYDHGDNPERYTAYSVTDRAVYCPMQEVHYRQMVMQKQGGEWKPLVGQPVLVTVTDAQGQKVFENKTKSGEFGSVNGAFTLSSSAPLGEYDIQATLPGISSDYAQLGGSRFRVEEYKKPEFEVMVTPEAGRVKLGAQTGARIQARYYFGGPVPNAKVTYRVYRNYYAQFYQFPRPFDFLYHYYANGDYDTYYRNGEVMTQGEARTDEKGEAKVSFATTNEGSRWQNADLSYTIEADVQDASRRVISALGSVKATRHDVAVFLNFPHGYATKGDRVDVEVMTLNPSDQPVAAVGTAKVYRQPKSEGEKETVVYEQPLKTDAHGRAILRWQADTSGYFRVVFETHDSAQEAVSSSLALWVEGPELNRGRFLFQGVSLFVENQYYEEEQTARVLLVTPVPDCTVLITREANNEILSKQVLRVAGRSQELKIPLSRKDVPNVFLSAVCIRDGQILQSTQELFVPPARQFAHITVQADKGKYQPGEKAHLRLAAQDWRGRPLRTELSVSVADAALNYIQKDYAPDIRAFFYGDRRSQSVGESGSPAVGFAPQFVDEQPVSQFKLHELLLPEGMGQLSDWPGIQRNAYIYLSDYDDYSGARYRGGGFGGVGFGPPGAAGRSRSGEANGLLPAEVNKDDIFGLQTDYSMVVLEKGKSSGGGRAGALAPAQLRTRFLDTAFWTPAVVTDAQGHASVDVTWPDNLTQWRAVTVGTSATAQVGSGETRVVTKKDLLVRLQAPRFFVERDTLTLTANVQNSLPNAARVQVKLDLEGGTAEIVRPRITRIDKKGKANLLSCRVNGTQNLIRDNSCHSWIEIPKNGEKRVDWTIRVKREGTLRVRMSALSQTASDATEMTFPVLVHGVERATAQGGLLRDQTRAELAISLPKARKPKSSELVVSLNPSLAAIMLDALPYLSDYPYGCIEQTMSRFLPTVVVTKTLRTAGYDLEALGKRAKLMAQRAAAVGGRVKVANSPYTYPQGRPGVMQTAQLGRYQSPVFDSAAQKNRIAEGLTKIQQFQHGDGGWGWWPTDSSDAYMTAYVLYGLLTARQSDVAVDAGIIKRGLDFLQARFLEEDDFHRMAYESRVLAMEADYRAAIRPVVTGRLFANRERLSAYSKALLALALYDLGDKDKAAVLLRNVETTAKVDAANGTASWNPCDRWWWHWYNDRVETNAVVLQAYMAIQPQAKLAPMLMKWLVNNRRANTWHSTRATAMAVYALADYARVNKELAPDYTLTVNLGGRVRRVYAVNRDNALFFDNQFVVPDEMLRTGRQTLTITKQGQGACYYDAYTRYFSLEEPIKATGNEIFVTRRYFRLLPQTASGQPRDKPLDAQRPNPFLTGHYELLTQGGEWTGWQDGSDGPRYERVELKDGETVTSGDLLEVELQLEAKNDYEYLAFEDMKPAGCEPVELRSGFKAGLGVYSNMELRDQKVAFFLNWMPQGRRTLSYRLRAEIPGQFHVLPTNGYAMYAPDIRALSDETRLAIRDEPSGLALR